MKGSLLIPRVFSVFLMMEYLGYILWLVKLTHAYVFQFTVTTPSILLAYIFTQRRSLDHLMNNIMIAWKGQQKELIRRRGSIIAETTQFYTTTVQDLCNNVHNVFITGNIDGSWYVK